jgi:dual specificity MAP kinase phosphatase
MTTDDDSNKLVAPSVYGGVIPSEQGSPSDEGSLFDVPAELLQHPEQLSLGISSGGRSTTVFRISAQQYSDLQANYAKHPLPSDSLLFPWLHGVNGSNYQECLFFGVRRMVVPKHRGLVLIHATDIDKDRSNNVSSDVVGTPPSALRSRLVQSFLPQDILTLRHRQNLEEEWVFRDAISTKETPGIHLRNFKIQSWRYASISDIVVYGDQAETIAHRVSMAQRHIFEERKLYHQRLHKSSGRRAVRNSNDIIYRIFIIEGGERKTRTRATSNRSLYLDTIDTFERCFPGLVWYNSNGLLLNDISLLEREKMEMRKMSSAKELTKNVWVSPDYLPCSKMDVNLFVVCVVRQHLRRPCFD